MPEQQTASKIRMMFGGNDAISVASGDSGIVMVTWCDNSGRHATGPYSEIEEIANRSGGNLDQFWSNLERAGLAESR